jgi:hypothetical protein
VIARGAASPGSRSKARATTASRDETPGSLQRGSERTEINGTRGDGSPQSKRWSPGLGRNHDASSPDRSSAERVTRRKDGDDGWGMLPARASDLFRAQAEAICRFSTASGSTRA